MNVGWQSEPPGCPLNQHPPRRLRKDATFHSKLYSLEVEPLSDAQALQAHADLLQTRANCNRSRFRPSDPMQDPNCPRLAQAEGCYTDIGLFREREAMRLKLQHTITYNV